MQKIKTVGIVSPSIALSKRDGINLDAGVGYLESLGLRVVLAPTALNGLHLTETSDKEKARDIMGMYENPKIDVLMAAHGGAGALRVLEYLDYEVIKNNPKPIIGFSDTTSLQMAVYAKTKNPFVTGFLPEYEFRDGDISPLVDECFHKIIKGEKITAHGGVCVNPGEAEGVLLGECLSTISDLNGTPYYPNIKGAILLLEDECEVSYKLSLMLTQLKYNPDFREVRGIVIGKFSDCKGHQTFGSVADIVSDFAKQINVPLIKDFDFGHFKNRYVLPCGVKYKLDANTCRLEQLENL